MTTRRLSSAQVFALSEVDEDLYVVATSLPTATLEELTESERSVVLFAVRGLNDTQIAEERGCSRSTVANQLHSAYATLNVTSRVELAKVVMGS